MPKEYKRNCPQCGKELFYSSASSLSHCRDKKCNYCANVIRGKTSNRLGCHHSNKTKQSMSLSKLGIKKSDITKKKMSDFRKKLYSNPLEIERLSEKIKEVMNQPDIRKKHINALHHSKWIKVRTDKGQLEMIQKWNRLGFHFEPNYQIHTDTDLFYVDGYDKEKNIVMEYDSLYHNKLNQQEKDLIRQQKIIDILKPKKFWRYDAMNKQFRNILV